jgi:beta-lactamase class A
MKKKIIYLPLLVIVGLLVYFTFKEWGIFFDAKRKLLELQKRKIAWKVLEKDIAKELEKFNGEAGIIIEDLNTGWKILINKDKLFPSASLVKIPIMAACVLAVNENKLRLDESLVLRAADRVPGSGNLKEFPAGAKFSVRELIGLMITESDNTAANMLIERLGFEYLNDCFKKLRLKDTNISRLMMDFASRKDGVENFTTPFDLAFLLKEIYEGRLIKRGYSSMCLEFLKQQKIRDRIPAWLPRYVTVAHKTGLENGICHDAGIVFTPNKNDFLIVVLTKHAHKSARLAKLFIRKLAFCTYNYYQ